MCLITIMPPVKDCTTKFNYDWLKNATIHNSDGSGIAFIEDLETSPRIVIKKGFFKISNLIKLIKRSREENPESHFLIHQRAASKGVISYDNCHPFKLNDGVCFAHNGTFFGLGKKDKSDTYRFSEILKDLPDNWYEKDIYNTLIARYAEDNKLAFLRKNNTVRITNLDKWLHEEEYLFSNNYYIDSKKEEKYKCCECGAYGVYYIQDKCYCYKCRDKHNPIQQNNYNVANIHCKVCNCLLLGKEEVKDKMCFFCKKKEYKGV